MSRKIIRDFIKQAGKLDNDQAARYFDTIMEVYEDCVHTANERVATLESDTLWLLVEYRRIVEAKDNTPEEKQQHRMAQGNLWQLLSVLIDSTADKGIYLSEAFIKKYENVDFVGFPFGEYVRECYNIRKWHTPEPQQKQIEAPQQPIGGNSGELAGSDNENAPAAPQQPIGIITINNTDLEISVYNKAITKEYMTLKPDGTYKWNKTNRLLAYMCGRLYCGDRVRENKSDYTTEYKKGRGKLPAKELKKLFGADVGKTRDNIDVPGHYDIIDELFNN